LNKDSSVNVILHLLQNFPTNLQQRFVALCWSLWQHQNLKNLGRR